jgi:hypothetical protein
MAFLRIVAILTPLFRRFYRDEVTTTTKHVYGIPPMNKVFNNYACRAEALTNLPDPLSVLPTLKFSSD